MIVDRYYYHQLNKQEQEVYKAFYDGVMAHEEIIPIPVRCKFSQESFERIFMAMTRDNPLIYFLNQSACSTASDMFGHLAFCPQYFFSKEKVKEYNRKIEKVVNELAGQLRLLECSDYEKEIRIHDWICQNIEYDYEGTDKSKLSRVIASHNILGVFAHHKAQCEGIAKAVKVLLNAVDVKCIVVTGDAVKNGESVPHAWNIVKCDGQYYYVDTTWGDPGYRELQGEDVTKDFVAYEYLCCSGQMLNQTHTPDTTYPLPECTDTSLEYYRMKGRYLETADAGMTLDIMKQAYNDGKKYTKIQYASNDLMNQIMEQLKGDLSQQMMEYMQAQSGQEPKETRWEYQPASSVLIVYWE